MFDGAGGGVDGRGEGVAMNKQQPTLLKRRGGGGGEGGNPHLKKNKVIVISLLSSHVLHRSVR